MLAKNSTILALVGAVLLAQLASQPASGQQRQQSTAAAGTKGGQPNQSASSPAGSSGQAAADRQRQQQVAGAPFFSIAKDGKTSARTIQQQQSQSPAQLGGAGASRTSGMQAQVAGSGQQQQATTSQQGFNSIIGDEPSGEQSQLGGSGNEQQQQISQQQTVFGSPFNQLSGSGNNNNMNIMANTNAGNIMDDFSVSTAVPTQSQMMMQQQAMSDNDLAAGSAGGDLMQQQRQQQADSFTTTGASASTQSAPATATGATPTQSSGAGATESPMQVLGAKQAVSGQFTMATGAPISSSATTVSTPSSLSMSLDGMIMNSRPRSDSTAGAKKKATKTSGGSASLMLSAQQPASGSGPASVNSDANRPQARVGDFSSMARGLETQTRANTVAVFAKAAGSRRVPFNGVAFSSPATKGLRTKPKASNQVVMSPEAQHQSIESAGQRQQALVNQLSQDRDARQMLMDANIGAMMQQQQMDSQMQGFGEEQQQQQQQRLNSLESGEQVNAGSGDVDLMKNLVSNGQSQQAAPMATIRGVPVSSAQAASIAANNLPTNVGNGVVMSVMSSADGNRRLVMMARDAFDSLQRFAVQQQAQQTSPTKGKGSGSGGQQSKLDGAGQVQAGGWWPSGQMVFMKNANGNADQKQQPNSAPSLITTTSTTMSSQLGRAESNGAGMSPLDHQQQEVQVQTTTSAPLIAFGGANGVSTTAASAPTSAASITTTTQQPTTTAQFASSTLADLSSPSSRSSAANMTTTSANANSNSDSFREVLVSTLVENEMNVADQSSGGSQQSRPVSTASSSSGSTAKQQATLGGSSGSTGFKTKTKSAKNSASSTPSGSRPINGNGRSANKSNTSSSSPGTKGGANGKAVKSSGSSGQTLTNGSSWNGRSSNGAGGKQNKSGSKSSSGRKQQQQVAAKKSSDASSSSAGGGGSSTVRVTNGQQQPAAMMSRAFETQRQQSPDSNGNTGAKLNRMMNFGGDESGMIGTTTASAPRESAIGGAGELGGQAAMTTMSSVGSKQLQPAAQPKATGVTPSTMMKSSSLSDDDLEDQSMAEMNGMSPASGASSGSGDNMITVAGGFTGGRGGSTGMGSRLMPMPNFDANLDRQLDELERNGGGDENGSSSLQNSLDGLDGLRAGIPGEPKLDYPIYSAPPKTSFDCMAQSCPAGYYADMETQCQVFHICQNDGRFDTFLCPNGTIFSQQHFVCVWWWQVDCQQSATFYKLNDGIYCNSMFPNSISSSAPASSISQPSSPASPLASPMDSSSSLPPGGSSVVRGQQSQSATTTTSSQGSRAGAATSAGRTSDRPSFDGTSSGDGSSLTSSVKSMGSASGPSGASVGFSSSGGSPGRLADSGSNAAGSGAPTMSSSSSQSPSSTGVSELGNRVGSSQEASSETPMTMTNASAMRQQNIMASTGDATTDADLDLQHQQQLELLSRKA